MHKKLVLDFGRQLEPKIQRLKLLKLLVEGKTAAKAAAQLHYTREWAFMHLLAIRKHNNLSSNGQILYRLGLEDWDPDAAIKALESDEEQAA